MEQEIRRITEQRLVELMVHAASREKNAFFEIGLIFVQAMRLIEQKYANESYHSRSERKKNLIKELEQASGKAEVTLRKYALVATRYPPEVITMYPSIDPTIFEELLAAPWLERLSLLNEIAEMIEIGQIVTAAYVRHLIRERYKESDLGVEEKLRASVKGTLIVEPDTIIIRKRTKSGQIIEYDLFETLSGASGLDVRFSISFDIPPEDMPEDEYARKVMTAEQIIERLREGEVVDPDTKDEQE